MTFEELLVKYFYQQKQVSLEGFGTVTLTGAVPDTEMIHKNRHIPVEGIVFEHNLKAVTDENFVAFFAQQRGKIKPLAMSDIESHLQLARQLMNIGNPYIVEGLGSFEKQNNGSVILVPGHYILPPSDINPQPGRLKERAEAPEKKKIADEPPSGSSGLGSDAKKILLIVAVLIIGALAVWYFYPKLTGSGTASTVAPADDSLGIVQDTTASNTTANPATNPPATASTSGIPQWKAYFRRITEKDDALRKFKFYEGNKTVQMETDDSVVFRLFVVIESQPADTTRKIDSLRKFFARPVTLERIGQ